jgi:acetyltransferase-like isoleucine patch superfamily enzyme
MSLQIWPEGSVSIGERCVIDRHASIECRGRLMIGARVIIGHHVTIGVDGTVTIGDDCLIAELVSIRDHDHAFGRTDVPIREQGPAVADVTVGRDVWIGAKATLTSGVTIGDHAVVAAGAVVTRDVPEWSIVGGVPAREIGRRG